MKRPTVGSALTDDSQGFAHHQYYCQPSVLTLACLLLTKRYCLHYSASSTNTRTDQRFETARSEETTSSMSDNESTYLHIRSTSCWTGSRTLTILFWRRKLRGPGDLRISDSATTEHHRPGRNRRSASHRAQEAHAARSSRRAGSSHTDRSCPPAAARKRQRVNQRPQTKSNRRMQTLPRILSD